MGMPAMKKRDIHVHLRITRRTLVWAAAVLLVCCCAYEVVSESMTLTTYYPAPSGTYLRLVATGGTVASPRNTILARDAGQVGIGIGNPQAILDVNSTTSGILPPRMNSVQQAALTTPGSVVYNTDSGSLQYRSPTQWRALATAYLGLTTAQVVGATGASRAPVNFMIDSGLNLNCLAQWAGSRVCTCAEIMSLPGPAGSGSGWCAPDPTVLAAIAMYDKNYTSSHNFYDDWTGYFSASSCGASSAPCFLCTRDLACVSITRMSRA